MDFVVSALSFSSILLLELLQEKSVLHDSELQETGDQAQLQHGSHFHNLVFCTRVRGMSAWAMP